MQSATKCPACLAVYQVPTGVLGKRTRCTKCGNPFVLMEFIPEHPPSSPAKSDTDEWNWNVRASSPDDQSDAFANSSNPPPLMPSQQSAVAVRQAPAPREGYRRFLILRIIAGLIRIAAVVAGAILFLIGVLPIVGLSKTSTASAGPAAFTWALMMWSWGGCSTIIGLMISYLIELGLQIEANGFACNESMQRVEAACTKLAERKSDP